MSSSKTLIANAITAKGVSTSSTDSFITIADNIGKIPTISYVTSISGLANVGSGQQYSTVGVKQYISNYSSKTISDFFIIWKSFETFGGTAGNQTNSRSAPTWSYNASTGVLSVYNAYQASGNSRLAFCSADIYVK